MKYRPTKEQLERIKYHRKDYKTDLIVLNKLYKAEAFVLEPRGQPWIIFKDIDEAEWKICPDIRMSLHPSWNGWEDTGYTIQVDMSPLIRAIEPNPIIGKIIIPGMQSIHGINLINGAKVRPISYKGYLCLEIDNPREFQSKVLCGYSPRKFTILE